MVNKELCTGCAACKAACPVNAIQMYADEHGFLHPVIDDGICIHCNLCEEVCPVSKGYDNTEKKELRCFAVKSKDTITQKRSSSGGAFSEISKYILLKNGIVFGVGMGADQHYAEHIMIENEEDLSKVQGSKYVQSDVKDTFEEVKKALKEGRIVLFSGTPCQVAGLVSYLGEKRYPNLYLVDIICHGVASPKVWNLYLDYMEARSHTKAIGISFRSKDHGWKKYGLRLDYSDGSHYFHQQNEDLYLRGFISNLFLRPSCYCCQFKNDSYKSDITLADFWGVEDTYPEFFDENGVSLAIVHSQKGQEILNAVSDYSEVMPVAPDNALRSNPSYFTSVKPNPCSKHFWRDLDYFPVIKAIQRYAGASFDAKIRRRICKLEDRLGRFKI